MLRAARRGAAAGAAGRTPRPDPRLFAAACDISRAFDTVPLDKLQQVVEETLREEQYRVLNYAQARDREAWSLSQRKRNLLSST